MAALVTRMMPRDSGCDTDPTSLEMSPVNTRDTIVVSPCKFVTRPTDHIKHGYGVQMQTYGYWESADGTEGEFTVYQDKLPNDLDGNPMALVYMLEATTHEEAAAIHYIRMGFGPYHPMGEPIKCPECSHGHYYLGSGACHCGYTF